jgi:hypothetical protein
VNPWLERLRSLPTLAPSVSEARFIPPAEISETPEVMHISYQRIFYDWDLADGTYTPEQLRKAKIGVKPWGPVQSYTLTGRGSGRIAESRRSKA